MPQLKFISWNINGIRAAIKKGFWGKIKDLNPDFLCLQEIKCGDDTMQNISQLDPSQTALDYNVIYHCASNRKGYSGTAIFFRQDFFNPSADTAPDLFDLELQTLENNNQKLTINETSNGLGVEEFDVEGRVTSVEFEFEQKNGQIIKIKLINGYYPQGGRGQYRIDYKIRFYKEVANQVKIAQNRGYLVIICGDLNTTVADIDLARPKENRQTTGCLPEERAALNWFFETELVDSFRYLYPELADKYTYWDQITRARERNSGWRIDYFLVDKKLLPFLKSAQIHEDIFGSDHCPVSLILEWE